MKDEVNVVFDNGYQVQTSDVFVNYKAKEAHSKKDLSVRGEKIDVDSSGFYIRQNGEELDLTGPARILLKSPERNVVVTAQKQVEMRQKTQTLTAFQDVVLNDNLNRVYCDELTAYFNHVSRDKNQYTLRSVQAQKNVRIKTSEKSGTQFISNCETSYIA